MWLVIKCKRSGEKNEKEQRKEAGKKGTDRRTGGLEDALRKVGAGMSTCLYLCKIRNEVERNWHSKQEQQEGGGEEYVVRGICQIGAAAQIKQFVFKI